MEFKINHDHNYYACPVARPNSQLFLVRLEWEAIPDEVSDASNENLQDNPQNDPQNDKLTEDDDRDFTVSMINFSGIQYIVVSLERAAHSKVIEIANELNLKIIPGYPLARVARVKQSSMAKCPLTNASENDDEIKHFPIRCAADSIFAVEGYQDINDPHELLRLKTKESLKVQSYLQARYQEMTYSDELNNDIVATVLQAQPTKGREDESKFDNDVIDKSTCSNELNLNNDAVTVDAPDVSNETAVTDDLEKVQITLVTQESYQQPPRKTKK